MAPAATNPEVEPTPAKGATLTADKATSKTRKGVREWQEENKIDRDAQVKIKKISHVRYQHPDINEATTFFKDFGMTVVQKAEGKRWFGGYGSDQYVYYAQEGEKKFLGGTFEVESYAELEKAAKIEGASPITELTDSPGGGHIITLIDPMGFPINLIYGQTPKEGGPFPEALTINYEANKNRLGQFQRFESGPAPVHKLGHYGLVVLDFVGTLNFYTRNFNFVPTDFLFIQAGPDVQLDVAAFFHIDNGQEYTDHHTLFLATHPTANPQHPLHGTVAPHVHHTSYEVHDFDSQNLGHSYLASKGYKSVWGVGRHILGSQIFDYWWDVSDNMVEHYADGDLVNEDTPIGWAGAGSEGLAAWGPDVPEGFME